MKNIIKISGFGKVSFISNLLSREYASDFLKLLINYKSISASEAASRLEIHIRTAQDFLDGLVEAGIVEKKIHREDKRPYFRYQILNHELDIKLNLNEFRDPELYHFPDLMIREAKGSGAIFTEGKNNSFRAITLFEGRGRSRKEKRISLTQCQGRFLFHLPFPTQDFMLIKKILERSGLEESFLSEISDIVRLLKEESVIEISN